MAARFRGFKQGETVKYVPDHQSFGRWIMSEEMRSLVMPIAEQMAADATATAPVPGPSTLESHPNARKPNYSAKREGGAKEVGGNMRVVLRVEGEGPDAQRAEFGFIATDQRQFHLRDVASDYGDWKPGE